MWKKVNPGMEYVIAAIHRIAAERGKECHVTTTMGQYRICVGCPKLVTKKEVAPAESKVKGKLLKDWDAIIERLKRSGYDLSTIYLTAKKEEED